MTRFGEAGSVLRSRTAVVRATRLLLAVATVAALGGWLISHDWRWAATTGLGCYVVYTLVLLRPARRTLPGFEAALALPPAHPLEEAADDVARCALPLGLSLWMWTGARWPALAGVVLTVTTLWLTTSLQNGRARAARQERRVEDVVEGALTEWRHMDDPAPDTD
jgi:hypothetical protein